MNNIFQLIAQLVPPWVTRAKCAEIGGEQWFPEAKGTPSKAARQICRECPVMELCREYAVVNHINYGIWGDTSPTERVTIRRERGLAEQEPEDELDLVAWSEVDFQDAL